MLVHFHQSQMQLMINAMFPFGYYSLVQSFLADALTLCYMLQALIAYLGSIRKR